MPRKRKTPKEGSSSQGQPSQRQVHGQQQQQGQPEQPQQGQPSQPRPPLQQSQQHQVPLVSQEGLPQTSPGSLQGLERPQQTLQAAQGREYTQSLQYQQGRGQPLPYHGQAGQGRGRVGEAQGTGPVSGLSMGSYSPVATVGPSIPDLPQAVLSQAPAYHQPFVAAGTGPQSLPQGLPPSLPPESAGPPIEEQLQKLTLQVSKQEVAGPSQVEVPPISSKQLDFPRRPGKGLTGIKCLVKANHFITELPDKDLHQYDVAMTPEVTSRVVNRAVMKQLVNQYRDTHLGRRLPAYDGRRSLYTAGPLPFTSKEFNILLVEGDDGTGGQRRDQQFRVVIKFAARADLHHLGQFLSGRQADAPQEALQVLDIVLRELPTERYTPVGRSFYSPDLGARQSLGEGLESWRGFYQSIRPTQMGLSLNIDMSSTAFIEPLPVVDFVSHLLGKDVTTVPLSDTDRVKIKT